MRTWRRWGIAAALLLGCSLGTAYGQGAKKELLYKTWKLKKVLVDGDRNPNRIVNDHLVFSSNMQYRSFDSQDKIGRYATGGPWIIDKTGHFIIQNPGTPMEKKLRVKKLSENNLVFELNMQKSTWQVHMKPE
jgi:hypothetical protein